MPVEMELNDQAAEAEADSGTKTAQG
jgi:hypothetical protein